MSSLIDRRRHSLSSLHAFATLPKPWTVEPMLTLAISQGRQTPRGRMLGLQAIPSPLYRATGARIAEAAAGAGCGEHTRGRMREFQGVTGKYPRW
jgi:hypothetical protein